jgi:hypothetical protein
VGWQGWLDKTTSEVMGRLFEKLAEAIYAFNAWVKATWRTFVAWIAKWWNPFVKFFLIAE